MKPKLYNILNQISKKKLKKKKPRKFHDLYKNLKKLLYIIPGFNVY